MSRPDGKTVENALAVATGYSEAEMREFFGPVHAALSVLADEVVFLRSEALAERERADKAEIELLHQRELKRLALLNAQAWVTNYYDLLTKQGRT